MVGPRKRKQDPDEEEELQALPSDESDEEEEEEYEDSELEGEEGEEDDEEEEEEDEEEPEEEVKEEAPATKKRKTGPHTSTTADTDTRVEGTKATVTDPNTYQVDNKTVVDDHKGAAEEEPYDDDEEDEEDGEEEDGEEDDGEEEHKGEDDEPAVKTKIIKGSEAKTAAVEAETEDFDDED